MGDVPVQLQLENQVCFPLYSAANAVTRAYSPHLKPLGLTYLQYIVMMVLWSEPELSVSGLGERVMLDSGTLTPLLKRLEARGLVTRRRSNADERVRVISITPEGQTLQAQAEDIPEKVACSFGLESDELSQMKALCHKVLLSAGK